jgi:2-oxoglutarate/2-oxoacid ferredoxin oxidoreductase subunit alpha
LSTHDQVQTIESAVVRFAGDSGDGMQLTGSQFTNTTAVFGSDLATLPDFPAEIRAPAGSLAGVSGFQINFSSEDIRTPGDAPSVLIAMNPAALKTNIEDLIPGGIVITNSDTFTPQNLKKAGYASNPLEDDSLQNYHLHKIPITSLTVTALESIDGITAKEADRSKNFFALGLAYWLFDRSMDLTLAWIEKKFKKIPQIVEANSRALKAGLHYGETAEMFSVRYHVSQASVAPGTYRNITGNQATALGFLAASQRANKALLYASYPITPASDILHELARFKSFGVKTVQAEDEIAAAGVALGAAFAGGLGLTGTSGPGLALKAETIGLAVMVELPMVIINVQRGGPSTGLPTKTEQADLLQAFYGRNSESPLAIVAPATPGDCFHMAVEAFRIAVKYMTPVIYLSDGYIGNGSEPWRIPDLEDLPKINVNYHTDPKDFAPYRRDPQTLARPWTPPGTPELEHRIGGIEKDSLTGNVSYDPHNHEKMIHTREEKIQGIARDIPDLEIFGEKEGEVLILGWGSTYGAITSAAEKLQKQGKSISSAHLRYLNPFPKNTADVLKRFRKILIPELNLGQMAQLIRAKFLVPAVTLSKVQGRPFTVNEIVQGAEKLLSKKDNGDMTWAKKKVRQST